VKVVFFLMGFGKGQEGETTSATLGSLQHRWPHACSRAKKSNGVELSSTAAVGPLCSEN